MKKGRLGDDFIISQFDVDGQNRNRPGLVYQTCPPRRLLLTRMGYIKDIKALSEIGK